MKNKTSDTRAPWLDDPTLRNFPMQANGAEMMRISCCLATERRGNTERARQECIEITIRENDETLALRNLRSLGFEILSVRKEGKAK